MSEPKYWGPSIFITGGPKTGKRELFQMLTGSPYYNTTYNIDTTIGKKKVRMNFMYCSPSNVYTWTNPVIDVFIVLIDLTDEKALENLPGVLSAVCDTLAPGTKTYLIGNKLDDVQNRKIKEEDARAFASQRNMPYHEISVLCNVNVFEVFEIIKEENSDCILRNGCVLM